MNTMNTMNTDPDTLSDDDTLTGYDDEPTRAPSLYDVPLAVLRLATRYRGDGRRSPEHTLTIRIHAADVLHERLAALDRERDNAPYRIGAPVAACLWFGPEATHTLV